MEIVIILFMPLRKAAQIWLLGQAVKTSPFHGGNTGSIPVGVMKSQQPAIERMPMWLNWQSS